MNSMDIAPKDGTMISLFVDYSAEDAGDALEDASQAWTIGFNQFEHTGVDEWQFAGWDWEHDCFTEGRGTPIGWLPWESGK